MYNIHRILLIAKRDYLATIRTKAFIIGLVVAPILFGGGFLGVALMANKPDIKERHVAIVDGAGIDRHCNPGCPGSQQKGTIR